MASCTAVIGAITTSSWSCTPLEPLGLVTPMTSKLVPSMRTDWPTGSWPAKRFGDDGRAEDHHALVLS